MPMLAINKWKLITSCYNNLLNRLGSTDRRRENFHNSGSYYYTYKCYFSDVPTVCAYADGLFTTVGVRDIGLEEHRAVFHSPFHGRLLELNASAYCH